MSKKKEEGWRSDFCAGDLVSVLVYGRVLSVGRLTGKLCIRLNNSTIELYPDQDELDITMLEKDEDARIRERNLGIR